MMSGDELEIYLMQVVDALQRVASALEKIEKIADVGTTPQGWIQLGPGIKR